MLTLASGKAMLFGEYAVLEGAPALVAAVDRCASARPVAGWSDEPTPFVREALVERERAVGMSIAPVEVDSSALRAGGVDGRKLGLGSSAAVTVAVFGLHEGLAREETWRRCQAAHVRAQGAAGSGADVAAAIWGGVIRFARRGDRADVAPVRLGGDLELLLVDTGVAASTGERLARLDELRRRDARRHAALLRPLVELARSADEQVTGGEALPLEAVHEWNQALAPLGEAIDLPTVGEAHRAVAECARSVGGAAKPSGAGGGDLALCFVPAEGAARLRTRLLALGFQPLDVKLGAPGLRCAEDPSRSRRALGERQPIEKAP